MTEPILLHKSLQTIYERISDENTEQNFFETPSNLPSFPTLPIDLRLVLKIRNNNFLQHLQTHHLLYLCRLTNFALFHDLVLAVEQL